MLLVLPPSERKAGDGDGPPLDLATLSFPKLGPTRRRVLKALGGLCSTRGRSADPQRAADLLGWPKGQVDDALARARALRTAPTLPVSRLYTGVLYENLALETLDADRAADRIVVFSGLWGALRLTDRVPPYRLAMGVALPPVGRLAALWRPALARALRPDGLVVDLRSGPYAAAWKPDVPSVAVRVFRERVVAGEVRRSVVSHMAKATRGALAHDLLAAGADPQTPGALLKAVTDLGYTAELDGPNLDVVLHT